MTPKYAAETSVSTEKSRSEIEGTLRRYGATSFAYGYDAAGGRIAFEIGGRRVRLHLTYPDPRDFEHDARGRARSAQAARNAHQQAMRQRWRALALIVKAKLEAVSAGITTVEEEFLSGTILPNGATVGEWSAPLIADAYISGKVPPLLIEGPREK